MDRGGCQVPFRDRKNSLTCFLALLTMSQMLLPMAVLAQADAPLLHRAEGLAEPVFREAANRDASKEVDAKEGSEHSADVKNFTLVNREPAITLPDFSAPKLALLDRGALGEMETLRAQVEVLELNLQDGFEDRYVDHLALPSFASFTRTRNRRC